MSKKTYVGVNGIARNVKNIYVGVNGVARKVVKGYVGVNGVARQFWNGGGPSIPASWDYWTSVSGTLVSESTYNSSYVKENNLIAYYALALMESNNADYPNACLIVMSPFEDATTFSLYEGSVKTNTYTYNSTITDVNNITWYVNAFRVYDQIFKPDGNPYSKDCFINWDTTFPNTSQGKEQAIQTLLDKIYAIPFVEDYSHYQVRDNVVFSRTTSIRKTIRKAYGDLLWLNTGWYRDHQADYMIMSDNVDAIVEELITRIGNDNFIRIQATFFTMYDEIRLTVYHTTIPIPWTCRFYGHVTALLNGFDAYEMLDNAPAGTDEIVRSHDTRGTYSISTQTNSGSTPIVGVRGTNGYNNWCKNVAISNISIDL